MREINARGFLRNEWSIREPNDMSGETGVILRAIVSA